MGEATAEPMAWEHRFDGCFGSGDGCDEIYFPPKPAPCQSLPFRSLTELITERNLSESSLGMRL